MNYPAIRIEGAILSPDLLDRIEEASGQRPADFGLDSAVKVKDEIARAWADAQDYWRIFQRRLDSLKADSPATTETRQQWVLPLLGLLGYHLEYQTRSVELNGKSYAISHRIANRGAMPIHIIGCREAAGLDRKSGGGREWGSEGVGEWGSKNQHLHSLPSSLPSSLPPSRMSAHAMVQEFLNLQDELYGIVTNGRVLRLLRDSSRLVKLTYLEFDLERIFTDGLFADFALFYRLLHATRLPATAESAAGSLIERYHQDSLDSGARIRDGLSRAVEQAIRDFGSGFLAHPANADLRAAVASGALKPDAYYQQLLRLIYRLLFLMVTEARDLVSPPQASAGQRAIYDQYYSVQRLRRLSEKRYLEDRRQHDLWLALLATFKLFEADGPGAQLGLAPLAGELFSPDAIGVLGRCTLGNDVLLGCLRALNLYRHPDTNQLIRVNYAALNVEEFGSVYEGLLEYSPVFVHTGERSEFAFAQGDERSTTGSHYTADDLVQPLLKHSLDYLIEERVREARELGSEGVARRGREAYVRKFLSGPGRVAKGDGSGRDVLSADHAVSGGGALRDDLSDPPRGDLDPGQHRRGVGTGDDSRVHPLSADRSGQHQGTGDASASLPTRRSPGSPDRGASSRPADRYLTDDDFPDYFFAAQAEVGLHALVPYSLLAAHSLLSLRVADISCGSGHILLAAARRIATALASVRTGEDQPSPAAFRTAVRDVIRTCIYGVDLNPLAVELCKVALWLEAHSPGEPLNFLDHHIKCGNAIVGFVQRADLEQGVPDAAFTTLPGDDKTVAKLLRERNKRERKEQKQMTLDLAPALQQQVDAVLRCWREVSALPERTSAEIDAKRARYIDFTQSQDAWLLNQIAAIPIAQFYLPKTKANLAITNGEYREYLTGRRPPQGQATGTAWGTAIQKRFFHWFLEFPEILARGGFDCILGNPPYLGGQALSGTYGHAFCTYVKWEYAPAGLSDLVAYFVRRIYSLLKPNGFTAFITTNSIKDGDVRKDGLEQVLSSGGEINFAVRNIKWPGQANLVVSLVAIFNGVWNGTRVLDGKDVSTISAYFEDSIDAGDPFLLNECNNWVYEGSHLIGDGFLLSHEVAQALLESEPRNKDVIFPVINGQELNSNSDQEPGRSIINFFDWSIDKAQQYDGPFQIVEQNVKPQRMLQNDQGGKDFWWRFLRPRIEMYTATSKLEFCFVAAATTKYLNFSAMPTNYVFTKTLKVFTTDRWDLYVIVQSTIHEVWARKYSGALGTSLRYSPSDCFETFPFPAGLWQDADARLAAAGERYHEHRRGLMRQLWLGLTDIYNLFHARDLTPALVAKVSKKDAAEAEAGYAGLLELRRLHVVLDYAVRDAYGWQDLDLAHGFVEVETLPENDRVRFTISPDARKEVLCRLLALNHARAAEEKERAGAKKKRAATANEELQPQML